MVKTDGTGQRDLFVKQMLDAVQISISWDNRYVLTSSALGLQRVSLADGKVQELLPPTEFIDASPSPDGRFIAVGGRRSRA